MKNLFSVLLLSVLVLTAINLFSQDEQSHEIDSSVPELFDFHEVIYPIWHTAYPNKDVTMLKDMVPEVNKGAERIYSANLPGILRDKADEWIKGVEKFRNSVKLYNTAAEGNDEKQMLDAAEVLHADFEMLVRIIRPVTKEIDEFHKVLYMIYHHYWPNNNTAEFNKAVDDLLVRAEELKTCVLPKWAEGKSDSFVKAADELYNSTKELNDLKLQNKNKDEIEKGIEKVHTDYQKLEALFD